MREARRPVARSSKEQVMPKITRRELAIPLVAAGAAFVLRSSGSGAAPSPIATRAIPSSGERLPVIGIGSWITFNVGDDTSLRDSCSEVLRAFFAGGGRLVDSSPMYGSSQQVIGYCLRKIGREATPFSADKVWTSSDGPVQIEESRRAWGVPRFDLLQVHNLLHWEEHLPTLFAMKAAGRLRYVGITTSEGRRHAEIEKVMASQPIDFVQVTYNAVDREAEQRILPLAQERKIAVLANRPFRQGALIDRVERTPLPSWAREIDCANWAQVLLKFIVSHPAVTCAIPATSRVDHVRQNVGAAVGRMPDEATRRRIASHVAAL
jgi:diketogulonate reductase-like aldo/keto reductase